MKVKVFGFRLGFANKNVIFLVVTVSWVGGGGEFLGAEFQPCRFFWGGVVYNCWRKNQIQENLLGWLNSISCNFCRGSINVDSRFFFFFEGGAGNIVGPSVLVLIFVLSFKGGFPSSKCFFDNLVGFSCRIQSGLKMMMRETNEIVQAVVGMVVISMYLFRFGELQKKRSTLSIQHHMSTEQDSGWLGSIGSGIITSNII